MQVQSLSWDDPLEKEMATHSSILAWEVPTHGGVWQATLHGVIRVGHDLATKLPQVMETTQTHTLCHVFACIHTHIYTLKKNHIYHIIHYTHTHTHNTLSFKSLFQNDLPVLFNLWFVSSCLRGWRSGKVTFQVEEWACRRTPWAERTLRFCKTCEGKYIWYRKKKPVKWVCSWNLE